jgi:hypothetical protein
MALVCGGVGGGSSLCIETGCGSHGTTIACRIRFQTIQVEHLRGLNIEGSRVLRHSPSSQSAFLGVCLHGLGICRMAFRQAVGAHGRGADARDGAVIGKSAF